MIIGLSGFAGVGKDAVADVLVRKHGFIRVGFADPLKRIAKEIYNFSDEALWGPSNLRSQPDFRYPRKHGPFKRGKCICCGIYLWNCYKKPCYLNARYVLQNLGTELSRVCYENTWVDYTIRVADKLLNEDNIHYNLKEGIYTCSLNKRTNGIVITDLRFKNEVKALLDRNSLIIRIKRTGYEQPKWNHPSETEQLKIPDSKFTYILNNDSTLDDLEEKVHALLGI